MDAPPTTGPDTERTLLPTRCGIWSFDAKPPRDKHRAASRPKDYPDDRWHRDFKGRESGWVCQPVRSLRRRLIGYICLIGLVVTIPIMTIDRYAILVFLAIIFLFVIAAHARSLTRELISALRAGQTHLTYDSFPYFMGEPLKAHWSSQRRYHRSDQLVFTLRCVQTVWVPTDEGRAASLYQCWADEYIVRRPQASGRDTRIPIEFRLPLGLPTTRLKDADPYHWEVEVCVQRPRRMTIGLYRVPVYEKPWASKKV